MSSWLTLQEYSNKEGVSISTLRRKIKASEIEFKRKSGKYYVKFKEGSFGEKTHLKSYYRKKLEEKDEEIKKLLEDKEDLLSLLELLEKEAKVLRAIPVAQAAKS